MPSYTRGKKREKLTYVLVTGTILYYGWNAKDLNSLPGASISTADLNALGHLSPGQLPDLAIRIIGAQSPKPPRFKKIITKNPTAGQQGNVSTFCAYNKTKDAENAGWQFAKNGRGITLTNNARTKTVGAELTGGGLYLFPMNANDVDANASALGLQLPNQINQTERLLAFSGVSRPRPAKMKLILSDGSSVSSFCSASNIDNALDSGWQMIEPEILN